MDSIDVIITILSLFDVVLCRECYNYKEDPHVRHCDQGCCGNKYEEFCCDVTLQIIGCAIGGVVAIAVLIAVAYYCYRKKSKPSQHIGLFGRFGMRPHLAGVRPENHGRRLTGNRHYVHPTHSHHSERHTQGHMNPAYMQHYPSAPGPTLGEIYPSAPMQPPAGPTAPMPPPYSIQPPPYVDAKEVPPPPSYSAVVGHMGPGYKYDAFYGNMPPPAT